MNVDSKCLKCKGTGSLCSQSDFPYRYCDCGSCERGPNTEIACPCTDNDTQIRELETLGKAKQTLITELENLVTCKQNVIDAQEKALLHWRRSYDELHAEMTHWRILWSDLLKKEQDRTDTHLRDSDGNVIFHGGGRP